MDTENKTYWEEEKLNQYFDNEASARGSDSNHEVHAIPKDIDDLVRLHKLIRSRKCFTVLEFGVGFSTLIIADALSKNKEDWNKISPTPKIRNRFLFKCFSVDTSEEWIQKSLDRIPGSLKSFVEFQFSDVEIGTYQGQLCHYYKNLPDVVPDFIYLDGPDPKSVKGEINGMSFQCDERTVMSGDLLLMEPIMLPGTFVLIDGRSNNARFLQRNLSRNFEIVWDREGDVTTMELNEERLGKYNLLGTDFYQ